MFDNRPQQPVVGVSAEYWEHLRLIVCHNLTQVYRQCAPFFSESRSTSVEVLLLAEIVVGAGRALHNLCFVNLKTLHLQSLRQDLRHGLVFRSGALTTLAAGLTNLEELVNPFAACPSHTCAPSCLQDSLLISMRCSERCLPGHSRALLWGMPRHNPRSMSLLHCQLANAELRRLWHLYS